jgi:hypothetical protein
VTYGKEILTGVVVTSFAAELVTKGIPDCWYSGTKLCAGFGQFDDICNLTIKYSSHLLYTHICVIVISIIRAAYESKYEKLSGPGNTLICLARGT